MFHLDEYIGLSPAHPASFSKFLLDRLIKKAGITNYHLLSAQGDPAEVIRRMGISEQTFYRWKKLYGGLGVGELRRLKQLEDENRQLKRLVADLSLDKHILQDVLSKKV